MIKPITKVLGKFKDEANGNIITWFIGLKPKMYCYKELAYNNDKHCIEEHKKAKGVPKQNVKRN